MKKYILISLLFHLSFLIFFKSYEQLGKENFNKIVPITFIATTTSPNPGSPVVVAQEVKKKEEAKPEPKKEKKKVEKKEIKSKVADKKEKKVEEKIEEKIEDKSLEQKVNEEEKESGEDGSSSGDSKNGKEGAFAGSNFLNDGDGGYIALSSEGINYEILNEVQPEYPAQAEMIGYSEKVVVGVKFLVGLKGEILKIEITKSHAKLGFDDEVRKAIKKWRFKPIFYHGKNIKVYFEKDFIFNPR